MRRTIRMMILLSLCFPAMNGWSDTLNLRSGVSYDGKIIDKTDDYVIFQTEDGQQDTYMLSDVQSIQTSKGLIQGSASYTNSQNPSQASSGTIDIPINPLESYNGVSRDYILNLRRQYIQQYSSLAPPKYQPNMNVWGQIQNGKPWWGVFGIYFYGSGEHSIEGDSYLSQFIDNPYLLVGFTTWAMELANSTKLTPKDRTPMPTQLIWEGHGQWGEVTYNLSDFYQGIKDDNITFSAATHLNLELINARDFGFKFFAIDSSQSNGINATVDTLIPLIQYIHTGGSCGYPGGCNNRSPSQHELEFTTTALPAKIYIKLWKNPVNDISQKEDMDFIIDIN